MLKYITIITYVTVLYKIHLMSAFDGLSINDYIVFPPEHKDTDAISSRSFFSNRLRWWPTTTIPYEIAPGFTESEQETIIETIEVNFHNTTCLKFVNRTTEEDYITIINDYSQVPAEMAAVTENVIKPACGWALQRTDVGGQLLLYMNLTRPDPDNTFTCVAPWLIVHELMHSLGFIHEHERVDSPCYLDLDPNTTLIQSGDYNGVDSLWPFDYKSIMLYAGFIPKYTQMDAVGSGNYFDAKFAMSELDLQKINFLFCKKPHFCDIHRQACVNINRWEEFKECVKK